MLANNNLYNFCASIVNICLVRQRTKQLVPFERECLNKGQPAKPSASPIGFGISFMGLIGISLVMPILAFNGAICRRGLIKLMQLRLGQKYVLRGM